MYIYIYVCIYMYIYSGLDVVWFAVSCGKVGHDTGHVRIPPLVHAKGGMDSTRVSMCPIVVVPF